MAKAKIKFVALPLVKSKDLEGLMREAEKLIHDKQSQRPGSRNHLDL